MCCTNNPPCLCHANSVLLLEWVYPMGVLFSMCGHGPVVMVLWSWSSGQEEWILTLFVCCLGFIDLSHKSHNAPVPYPIMHHFVTEMCMCTHFCYKVVHCGMHYGICETDLLGESAQRKGLADTWTWGRNKIIAIFAEHIFKSISLNKNYCNLIKISLKFVPKAPIDKKNLE